MPIRRTGGSLRGVEKATAALSVLFGNNFREARLKAGLTQAEVRELTGIRQNYISEIEHGLPNPTLGTMLAMAMAVGTEVHVLLTPPKKR